MSFNGSGTFVVNSSGQPVVAATLITAAAFNALTADVATGLSTCILKDGTQTITANIPFGGFKATGLADGTTKQDAATLANVVNGTGVYVGTVGGTADVITLTSLPAITAYVAGQTFRFIASGANTTNVTVAISGLAAKAITKEGATALVAGDIPSGMMVCITYDGTRFIIGTASITAAIAAATAVSADNVFRIVGSSDATKKLAFEVDGFTTSTTRTITPPDRSGTMTLDSTVASYSSTDTLAAGVGLALLSGASFAFTLPAAASHANREVTILHQGTSLSQVYTVTGNAAETIIAPDGTGNTYILYTNGERIRLKCNGTSWYVIQHQDKTEWADVGPMTITGTTSNPTKPTTPDIDKVYWRRDGNQVYLRYILQISSAAGSAAGSGNYLFTLPTNIVFDTTVLTPVATAITVALRSEASSSYLPSSSVANVDSTSFSNLSLFAYDTTHFQAWRQDLADPLGSGGAALTNAELSYNFELNCRAANWRV